ncbi:MAG: adenylate/guanylate cyclase domain-containing protein [Leptospiraceae bacterium]|nr:adenylate/guanylate cyclase domain-containing protein [Leptospiraceae bacterium]MCP5494086.1 adenylate/guanylate cyclase domain-containing protein [Leptospiraceae bacterium]
MLENSFIYKTEEQIIKEAERVLQNSSNHNNPLLNDYAILLKGYKKIYQRIQRLIKLGDTQQLSILQKALKEQKQLTNAYSRFVPLEYLEFLQKESITEVQLGDHVSKNMTVMFCDLRSFTKISENMNPQENFNFINSFLKRVSPIVRNHKGIIIKYVGDGIMAIFPLNVNDGINAAINMLQEVSVYNQEKGKNNSYPIEIGFGIHVGYMMVGMIGEENRMQGDALSDTVNLTSRLEGLTKYYQVSLIISEDAYKLIDSKSYNIRFLDNVVVKGRSFPIPIYEVFDSDPILIKEKKLQTLHEFEIAQEFYFNRQFAEAAKKFISILEILPHDSTTKLYLERSARYLLEGVPDDWTGMRIMTNK